MAWMSKITGIIYLADQVLGSGKTAGRINRVIKIIADRNINRITVLSRTFVVSGNIYQNLIDIDTADLLVAVTGMLWQDSENSGFFQFLYMAGQGAVGDSQTGSQFIHVHFLMFKKRLDQSYANLRTKCLEDRNRLFQNFNI